MSAFSAQQTLQLLAPIRGNRVLKDGKGHSHVSQQDITAHLIRVFGFGSFDTDVVKVECVYEQERINDKGELINRWDVCYRALLRLTIRDADGNEVCHFEDGSTATAQNQTRGDAHDLAYKSALSLAKKRTAINLGDQSACRCTTRASWMRWCGARWYCRRSRTRKTRPPRTCKTVWPSRSPSATTRLSTIRSMSHDRRSSPAGRS